MNHRWRFGDGRRLTSGEPARAAEASAADSATALWNGLSAPYTPAIASLPVPPTLIARRRVTNAVMVSVTHRARARDSARQPGALDGVMENPYLAGTPRV